MNRQLVAEFSCFDQARDIRHIQLWVNTLCEQVKSQRNYIDITCPLTITKKGAFNAVGASHQP